jgi:hypothetical protein
VGFLNNFIILIIIHNNENVGSYSNLTPEVVHSSFSPYKTADSSSSFDSQSERFLDVHTLFSNFFRSNFTALSIRENPGFSF